MQAGCVIILRHSQFVSGHKTAGICNNGTIVGQIIREENNSYTSQLIVLMTPDLIGRTVECAANNGTEENLIGVTTLLLTTGMSVTEC